MFSLDAWCRKTRDQMEIVSFRYLAAVVETGSFANAAAHTGLNPSTLTRRIAALEDGLGVTLLVRSRIGFRLTSGGAAVMAQIRLVADLEAIR